MSGLLGHPSIPASISCVLSDSATSCGTCLLAPTALFRIWRTLSVGAMSRDRVNSLIWPLICKSIRPASRQNFVQLRGKIALLRLFFGCHFPTTTCKSTWHTRRFTRCAYSPPLRKTPPPPFSMLTSRKLTVLAQGVVNIE